MYDANGKKTSRLWYTLAEMSNRQVDRTDE